jgi:hypothetical protein
MSAQEGREGGLLPRDLPEVVLLGDLVLGLLGDDLFGGGLGVLEEADSLLDRDFLRGDRLLFLGGDLLPRIGLLLLQGG